MPTKQSLQDRLKRKQEAQAFIEGKPRSVVSTTATAPSNDRRIPCGLRLSAAMLKAVKIRAAELEIPQYEFVEAALRQHLDNTKTR